MITSPFRLLLAYTITPVFVVVLGACGRTKTESSVTIRSLTAGDRACYLEVEDEQGQRREEMASFELCERNDLVGKRARLRFEPAQVMAESCQGNPDCKETETVQLVQDVELLP